jgi:hypothetical protein
MIKFYDNDVLIGSTESLSNDLVSCISCGIFNGFYCMIIDLTISKNSLYRKHIQIDQLESASKIFVHYNMILYSRFSIKFNMLGSKNVLVFNGNVDQDSHTKKVLDDIRQELDCINSLNSTNGGGVIVYPGKYVHSIKNAQETLYKSLKYIDLKNTDNLLFENGCGRGVVGENFDDLLDMIANINKDLNCNIRICLNVYNLHQTKQYDFTETEDIERLIDSIDKSNVAVGLLYICNTDTEYIEKDGLLILVEHCKKQHIPIITQTHEEAYMLHYIQYT